jgi:hypothetical protein
MAGPRRSPGKIRRLALFFAALGLGGAGLASAQDTHYWTYQYGTRATLLGGAVIGSVLDLSGTYYNPGGLSLIEDPETLMAAKVFHYPRVSLTRHGEGGVNINSSNLGPAPSLIAGRFKFKGLGKHWLGYSFLSRQDVKLALAVSSVELRDALPDAPGLETCASEFRMEEKLTEPWFGLTWAYRVRDNVGIGVSQYVTVRTHRGSVHSLVEVLTPENAVALSFASRQYRYVNTRVLWKIGAAFDFKAFTLGLTLTTPSLKLFGRGITGVNATVVGVDLDGDGSTDDFLAADYRDGLGSNFRTPLSLALGTTFKLGEVRLYASAEWFGRSGKYVVVDSEDFAAQSSGETISTDVTHELAAVLNVGVGVEYLLAPKVKTYLSFTTDGSARKPDTDTNLSLTDWNIYHLLTGAELTVRGTSLTVGIGYSFGDREIGRRPGIIVREGLAPLWEAWAGLAFKYSGYKLVAGFAF